MEKKMKTQVLQISVVMLIGAVAIFASGCNRAPSESNDGGTPVAETSHADREGSHGGWWCVEHGIPEEQCSMCSAKAAKACREKGDWCEEHNRAESQCFICDASRADKFAKLYEAKVGKKPPEMDVLEDGNEGE